MVFYEREANADYYTYVIDPSAWNGCFDLARIIVIHTVTIAKTILTTPE